MEELELGLPKNLELTINSKLLLVLTHQIRDIAQATCIALYTQTFIQQIRWCCVIISVNK